jgi:hypothetical protein
MAIDAKELVKGLRFEAWGTFNSVVDFTPENGERYLSFRFDYLGGQFNVEVEDSELMSVPEVGTPFRINGRVRYNNKNGSMSLVPEQRLQVPELSAEEFVKGLKIIGVGVVEDKKLTTMNRQTYKKVTLKWHGGLHLFKDMPDEMYARIPARGKFVRFQLGVTTHTERGEGGRQMQFQLPVLLAVASEELVMSSGSPSSGAPSAQGAAGAATSPRRATA